MNKENVSVETIIKLIKEEALRNEKKQENISFSETDFNENINRQETNKLYKTAKKVASLLKKVGLSKLVRIVKSNISIQENYFVYEINNFLIYDDEAFINNAYKLILQRDPDLKGKEFYLNILRNGSSSKSEIISSIYFSKERRDNKTVKIKNMTKKYFQLKLFKLPILGYIFKSLYLLFTLPKLLKRINILENQLENSKRINNLSTSLNLKEQEIFNYLDSELENKSSILDINELHNEIFNSKHEVENSLSEISSRINDDIIKTKNELVISLNETNSKIDNTISSKLKQFDNDIISTKDELINSLNETNSKIDNTISSKLKQFDDDIIDIKNELLNSLTEVNSKIDNNAFSTQNQFNEEISSIKREVNEKPNKKEIELYLQTVSYAKDYITLAQDNLQSLINETKEKLPKKAKKDTILEKINEQENLLFDNFYVEFENSFRGTRKEIKNKLKIYLPYLENLNLKKKEFSLLDLGCGRGEWLELLKDNNYTNIRGIDINSIMVSSSKKLNLDVTKIDILEYLKKIEDNSLAVITSFHLIEHINFNTFMMLLDECKRVLKKGGMIIFETPNPRNILVGSSDFYLDPTHKTPLHPETLKFIVNYKGFTNTNSYILSNKEIINFDDIQFDSVNDYINIGRDLCVIGYKK